MRPKSKFVAFLLSFIPGLSHLYIGHMERGFIYLLLTGAICGGSFIMAFITHSDLFIVSFFAGYAVIWLIALIDAFSIIGKIRYSLEYGNLEDSLNREEVKLMNNKIIALGLSIIPGAGHMYLGYQKKGLAYMGMFFFTIFFMGWLNLSFLLFIIPLIWFYSFFDAFHVVNGKEIDDADIDILNLLPRMNHEYIGRGLILLGAFIIAQKIFFPMISYYLSYEARNYIQSSIVSLIFIALGINMLRRKKEIETEIETEIEVGDEEHEE